MALGALSPTTMGPGVVSPHYGERAAYEARPSSATSAQRRSRELSRAESQLLQEERALTGDPKVRDASVQYEYTVGPDGQRYITGARVTYKEESDQAEGATSGRQADLRSPEAEKDRRVEAAVAELRRTDQEVRAHEAAHMAAGGAYAGAASYTYVQGPDGKRYAVGGEVPISAPKGRTPEETIRIMEQVRSAAMAPANPSGQDLNVAAKAASAIAQARQELAMERGEERRADGTSETAEARRDRGASPAEDFDPDLLFSFIASKEDRDQLLQAYNAPWAMGRQVNGSGAAYLGAGLVA